MLGVFSIRSARKAIGAVASVERSHAIIEALDELVSNEGARAARGRDHGGAYRRGANPLITCGGARDSIR